MKKARQLEQELIALSRRGEGLRAEMRGWNNAHIEAKLEELRVEYRKLHGKWMAAKNQLEMEI